MKILTHSIVSLIILFCSAALGWAGSPQDHPGQYDRADIEAGSRLYATQCVACHGPNGDMITGIDLRRGLFKTAVTDEDLTRVLKTGRPDSGMPAFALLQPQEVTGIVAFIRAGFDASASVKLGDPARGQALFSGKGNCASCHRVNGKGPRLASDLTEIGAIRTPASLQRMLLDPARYLIPANRSVAAVTRDGKTIRGRRLNEDTYTVQIIDESEHLVSLSKSDLRTLQMIPTSAMPSYEKTLSADEMADLIAYLLTLKGL
jgi:putative heme-binding domain-containing protein